MTNVDAKWDASVEQWACARRDISALVQIGSRVQSGAVVDKWSDYDYQLITPRPKAFLSGAFARELGRCWAISAQEAFGGVIKVTAVYEDALEADFVILKAWEVALAATANRFPGCAFLWPGILRRGVEDLRCVAGRGCKVIKGSKRWERRYASLVPFVRQITKAEFISLSGAFWARAVWIAKKIERGELFAAQRAIHADLFEPTFRLLEVEASLVGVTPRPEARGAERWLPPARVSALGIPTAADREYLRDALVRIADLFVDVSSMVGRKQGWEAPSHAEVRAWIARPSSADCSAAK